MKQTHHLRINSDDVSNKAIVVGDPDRVIIGLEHLVNGRIVSQHRGFIVAEGYFNTTHLTLAAIGIGGPSWAIGLEELRECGVQTFVRVGTSAILHPAISPGTLILAEAAYSPDSFPKNIISPPGDLYSSDLQLTNAIYNCISAASNDIKRGLVHSKDFLYIEEPIGWPKEAELTEAYKLAKSKCLVSDMETATLFAYGTARGVSTTSLLCAVNEDEGISKRAQKKAMEIAIGFLGSYNIPLKGINPAIINSIPKILRH